MLAAQTPAGACSNCWPASSCRRRLPGPERRAFRIRNGRTPLLAARQRSRAGEVRVRGTAADQVLGAPEPQERPAGPQVWAAQAWRRPRGGDVRRLARAAVLASATALVLAACGTAPDKEPAATATDGGDPTAVTAAAFKGCMVSDAGGFDDESFNQAGLEGLM